MKKKAFDWKWLFGLLIPLILTAIYYYTSYQLSQKELELKMEPIMETRLDIVGSEKCDLIIANKGEISISDLRINCWPRLVRASDFHVVSSVYGKIPWKTINKLVSHESYRFSIMEGLLSAQASKRCQLSMSKGNYLPILLVFVTYRRTIDGKLYNKQKYVYVGEDIETKKIVPFDLDEGLPPQYIDLREKIKEYDKKRLQRDV